MPTVQDILRSKGPSVHSIHPTASVLDAVNKMNQHKIGALVVMDGERAVGMFTERDVLRRVVGAPVRPEAMKVQDVMTQEVVCCGPEDELDMVSAIMKSRRVRHIPVCEKGGALRGLVSIGDLNAYNASTQEATLRFFNDYIYGWA